MKFLNAGCFLFMFRIFPNFGVQRTDMFRLEPLGDAVGMKSMFAFAPGYTAFYFLVEEICLAFYTRIHDVVTTYRTDLNFLVQRPQCNRLKH